MASGKTHARSTSTTIVIACIIIAVVLLPPSVQAFISGLIVGHYATPDVRDQHRQINEGERMVKAHFGKLAGRLWTLIWWIPAKVIPHRHWASHLPGVATVLAAAWLYAVPLLILLAYEQAISWELVGLHVSGWALQDIIHLAQDKWRIRW